MKHLGLSADQKSRATVRRSGQGRDLISQEGKVKL